MIATWPLNRALPPFKPPGLFDDFTSYRIGVTQSAFGDWIIAAGSFEVLAAAGGRLVSTGTSGPQSAYHSELRLARSWSLRGTVLVTSGNAGVHWGCFTNTSLQNGYILGYNAGMLDIERGATGEGITVLASVAVPSNVAYRVLLTRCGKRLSLECGPLRIVASDTTFGDCPVLAAIGGTNSIYYAIQVAQP